MARPRALSKAEAGALYRAVLSGASWKEIAARFGVSRETARLTFRREQSLSASVFGHLVDCAGEAAVSEISRA